MTDITFAKMEDQPSVWRYWIAMAIASRIDMERWGVQAIYLIGSVKDHTAGPGSDIDLLVHFRGNHAQQDQLLSWLRGWGECLAVVTGYSADNILDIHLITEEDIRNKTSFAVMIGSLYNSATLLRSL